jgi:hypothetical protein
MKVAVFWDVAQCSLAHIDRRSRGTYCLHHQGDDDDDGGSKFLWNVGRYLPNYKVQHPTNIHRENFKSNRYKFYLEKHIWTASSSTAYPGSRTN